MSPSRSRPDFSVCVYCGARDGVDPAFLAEAHAMGAGLAARGWRLVYGAGDHGMMGATARACLKAGGRALGVIPHHLIGVETQATDRNEIIVTETMHERKKVMLFNADAALVLPGGVGSLDEFFETLTWRVLGLHAKPIILVDAQGCWGKLVGLIDEVIANGFADPSLRDAFHVAPDAQAALRLLETA